MWHITPTPWGKEHCLPSVDSCGPHGPAGFLPWGGVGYAEVSSLEHPCLLPGCRAPRKCSPPSPAHLCSPCVFSGLIPHLLGDVVFLWGCNLLAHFINAYLVDDSVSDTPGGLGNDQNPGSQVGWNKDLSIFPCTANAQGPGQAWGHWDSEHQALRAREGPQREEDLWLSQGQLYLWLELASRDEIQDG